MRCGDVDGSSDLHVKGKAVGDDPAHMVAVCAPCSGKVGDPPVMTPTPRP